MRITVIRVYRIRPDVSRAEIELAWARVSRSAVLGFWRRPLRPGDRPDALRYLASANVDQPAEHERRRGHPEVMQQVFMRLILLPEI